MNEKEHELSGVLSITNGGTGRTYTYQLNNLEYAMDRKDREIKDLQIKLIRMEEEHAIHESNMILAEVLLFLLGVLVGGALMRAAGCFA